MLELLYDTTSLNPDFWVKPVWGLGCPRTFFSNVIAIVGAFNHEKVLVGAFSVIVNTTDRSFADVEKRQVELLQLFTGPGSN